MNVTAFPAKNQRPIQGRQRLALVGQPSSTDTLYRLRGLLEMAERGEVRGLCACFRDADGVERLIRTGAYEANPALAKDAAISMAWALTA